MQTRSKRALAEVDGNARPEPRINAKHHKKNNASRTEKETSTTKKSLSPLIDKKGKSTVLPSPQKSSSVEMSEKKENIEYGNKDNSKLRRFLTERGLSSADSREELISRLENSSIDYDSLLSSQISEMLRDRHLSCGQGSKAHKIKRLRLNDKVFRDSELEIRAGQPVNAVAVLDFERAQNRLDNQDQSDFTSKGPICAYDWTNSHWKDRSERELRQISQNRGMPGVGPKAAMLKFLDTGSVDYEDMYTFSLQRICDERSIPIRSGATKGKLVELLKEADVAAEKEE
ncbi:hypothetical protein EJ08DRAFT_659295 [Tothia fuscella]|uniref:SAP domain-containing protein n=1 Tax=Tothia fuscella TaxID=1048955 RepID=A0A9P4NW87_9PEZI|nr:hypothetical protein EJ08DRAFT_659295 [Tothia fuscella]